MEHYYLPLRFMAIRDKNQQFSALAKRIEQTVPEKLLGYLVYFLEDNYYFNSLPSPLPMNYTNEFKHSNLVRIRRGDIDASILGGIPTSFYIKQRKCGFGFGTVGFRIFWPRAIQIQMAVELAFRKGGILKLRSDNK